MNDAPKSDTKPTYPGGIDGMLEQMEGRREPLTFSRGEFLPPLDVDFAPWIASLIPAPAADPVRDGPVHSSNRRKTLELREELAGKSEFCALHGLLIAHLRKRDQPPQTAALFHRMWAEEPDHLLTHLDQRWLVSALTTFGDHGATEVQRRIGQAMTVLFGTMKLYESERRYSGYPATRPFPLKGKDRGPLPMEMDGFHLTAGGLDVNMLGRLWLDAGEDDVLRPLARHILNLLVHDPRTVFRRFRTMRKRKERRDTAKTAEKDTPKERKVTAPVPHVPPRRGPMPTWGVVCTTNAAADDILRFVAHYLALGAAGIEIYLDAADAALPDLLTAHPQVQITRCDPAYWQAVDKPRPEAHQLRQAHNATRAYRACPHDWLAHVDVDEFLIAEGDVARSLRFVTDASAQARIRPVELLPPTDGLPQHFKNTHRQAGQKRSVLSVIYPNYGAYLTGGFISHTSGKVFARTRIPDARLGIHGLRLNGAAVGNEAELPKMKLAHFHTSGFDHFRDRVVFRLNKGSYRKPEDDNAMRLGDVLDFILETEGEDGLRHFFDEVCADHPALRNQLAAHGMLFTHPLDLDAQVRDIFAPDTVATGVA